MNNLITNSERLILINQYKILSSIEKGNIDYYNDLIFYLKNGAINEYNDRIELHSLICQETYKEVHNILAMFELLGYNYDRLLDEDKKDIDSDLIYFQGFDNNHDYEHNRVKHILHYKQKTENLNTYHNIDFNLSDIRPLNRYRKMLQSIYENKFLKDMDNGYMWQDNPTYLSKEQIQTIINIKS